LGTDGHASVFAGRAHEQRLTDAPDPRNARFNLQRGITIDANGALYVADFRNNAIRRIDPDTGAVTTVVNAANGPTAVAVGADGTIYYLSTYRGAVVAVAPSGERTVLANQKQIYGDRGGSGAEAALRPADGLILTGDGLIFTDTGNNRVRALMLGGKNKVVTLLGNGHGGDRVGMGFETELSIPRSVVAVADGYVVADTANHRLLHFSNDPAAFIRK
jgi:sugar lactone lactonase YvrE